MFFLKFLLAAGIFIVFYSYLGYGILVWLLLKIKNILKPAPARQSPALDSLPPLTLVIAAFNEEDFIQTKIENSLALEYPGNKLQILFITDGSSDKTYELAAQYKDIKVLHQPERKGKIAAIHRAMDHVNTPIVVFSDANTLLNKESMIRIAAHYTDPTVGGVAGEKKILQSAAEQAAGAGEGIYWKYESALKKLDSKLYSVVGAAGELFSIRRELYEPVGPNVLLDDFIISLKICQRGYRIVYEPDAYASETPSASLEEEQKRKIRISAGAFQSILMLKGLLNIFKYPVLSFQYISHRVLRWTLCPLFLPIIFITNGILVLDRAGWPYDLLLIAQALFYCAAFTGWILSRRHIKVKVLYVPYYFFFQNLNLYLGFARFVKGRQSVTWDKAVRKEYIA